MPYLLFTANHIM